MSVQIWEKLYFNLRKIILFHYEVASGCLEVNTLCISKKLSFWGMEQKTITRNSEFPSKSVFFPQILGMFAMYLWEFVEWQ